MQEILSGNEAIARGAFEAGGLVPCAYPGTPSTELLENTLFSKDIHSSWPPNEKVALGGQYKGLPDRRGVVA